MSVAPVVRRARARCTVAPRLRTAPMPGAPCHRLAARAFARSPAPRRPRAPPPFPCVLSPDPVTTPGRPVPGGCVGGGNRQHRPVAPRGAYPKNRRAAATARTRTRVRQYTTFPAVLPYCTVFIEYFIMVIYLLRLERHCWLLAARQAHPHAPACRAVRAWAHQSIDL
eukprot:1403533-Prymnesium_polylepis.1